MQPLSRPADDRGRIALHHEKQIHQQAGRAAISIGEWMDGHEPLIRSIMVEEVPSVGLSLSAATALLDDAYDTSVHFCVSVEASLVSRSVA
jgi:hypothetical protein